MRPESTRSLSALLLWTFLPLLCVLSLLFAALVYNLLYDHILRQFDQRLIATSAIVGAMIDPADHDALHAEAVQGRDAATLESDVRYRRNVDAMRRIRQTLDLTYLYTQIEGGPQDVRYVFDSADGDDHTLIGTPDSMTKETMAGLKAVAEGRGVYVSPVEYQEQWGLLKAAAAPVYDSRGRISATAGADVNVGQLQSATQMILLQSVLIGACSMLLSLIATGLILRHVAAPIKQLTQAALRMASGDYSQPAQAHGPSEVMEFRERLTALGGHIAEQQAIAAKAVTGQKQALIEQALVAAHGADIGPLWLAKDDRQRILWVPLGADDMASLLSFRAVQGMALRGGAVQPLRQDALEGWRQATAAEAGGLLHWEVPTGTLRWFGAEAAEVKIDEQRRTLADGEMLVLADGSASIGINGFAIAVDGGSA